MIFDPSAIFQQIDDIKSTVGICAPAPSRDPLDALYDAAITLAIIRNAMDMLAHDHEGSKNLAPWQRELFARAHDHLAAVVKTLNEAHKTLRLEASKSTKQPFRPAYPAKTCNSIAKQGEASSGCAEENAEP